MTVALFGYGTLKMGIEPPLTVQNWQPDIIRGDMFDHGQYPVAINIGKSQYGRIHGDVLYISADELPKLDRREGPLFRRIRTTTFSGVPVYVYEYRRAIPPKSPQIDNWSPPL